MSGVNPAKEDNKMDYRIEEYEPKEAPDDF